MADDHSMTERGAVPVSSRMRIAVAIVALGVSQLVGWGCTFNAMTILAAPIGRELGLSREIVFSGVTLMMAVSAIVAPRIGVRVDRLGARVVMAWGSLIYTAALLLMSQAHGYLLFALAWAMIGAAIPMVQGNAAYPGLVQIVGPDARRAITAVTLISGLASTVFLPLTASLDAAFGWRGAYLVYAAMQLVVCLPIHLMILPKGAPVRFRLARGSGRVGERRLPPSRRRLGLALLVVWSSAESFVQWGINMQIVDLLGELGLATSTTVAVWSLTGVCQATSRLIELLAGRRYTTLTLGLASAFFAPAGMLTMVALGVSVWTAAAFAILFGFGHGLYAIARNALPLALFGPRVYGAYLGIMMRPQSLVGAVAPVVVAAVMSRIGASVALWIALLATLSGLTAMVLLSRLARAEQPGGAVA